MPHRIGLHLALWLPAHVQVMRRLLIRLMRPGLRVR
jgi:hypothetical protein